MGVCVVMYGSGYDLGFCGFLLFIANFPYIEAIKLLGRNKVNNLNLSPFKNGKNSQKRKLKEPGFM